MWVAGACIEVISEVGKVGMREGRGEPSVLPLPLFMPLIYSIADDYEFNDYEVSIRIASGNRVGCFIWLR